MFQTHLQHDSRNTQVIFTLETLNTERKKDIPPDYNSVVRMKEDEEGSHPTYFHVAGNSNIHIHNISEIEVDTS